MFRFTHIAHTTGHEENSFFSIFRSTENTKNKNIRKTNFGLSFNEFEKQEFLSLFYAAALRGAAVLLVFFNLFLIILASIDHVSEKNAINTNIVSIDLRGWDRKSQFQVTSRWLSTSHSPISWIEWDMCLERKITARHVSESMPMAINKSRSSGLKTIID